MGIESLDLSSVGVEMITNLYGANEVDGKAYFRQIIRFSFTLINTLNNSIHQMIF